MEPVFLTDQDGQIRLLVMMNHVKFVSFSSDGAGCHVALTDGDELPIPPELVGQLRRELAFLDLGRAEADEAAVLGGQP